MEKRHTCGQKTRPNAFTDCRGQFSEEKRLPEHGPGAPALQTPALHHLPQRQCRHGHQAIHSQISNHPETTWGKNSLNHRRKKMNFGTLRNVKFVSTHVICKPRYPVQQSRSFYSTSPSPSFHTGPLGACGEKEQSLRRRGLLPSSLEEIHCNCCPARDSIKFSAKGPCSLMFLSRERRREKVPWSLSDSRFCSQLCQHFIHVSVVPFSVSGFVLLLPSTLTSIRPTELYVPQRQGRLALHSPTECLAIVGIQ